MMSMRRRPPGLVPLWERSWKEEVEVAYEVINVEVEGEETRGYSIDEFGRMLQTSQWSLAHRIEICKVLECNVYIPSMIESSGWMMTPLSRQEYAKQSLALVDRSHGINVNDINVSDWPSLEEMSLLVKKELDKELDRDSTFAGDYMSKETERLIWREHLSKLRNDMMGHVFGDWKELRNLLEEELESLREKDKLEEWYRWAFEGRGTNLQPWEIYAAMEKGHVDTVHKMMADIGREQWGKLKPREYRGATPLHWAALHNRVDKTLWDLIDSDPWPVPLFDDFGFKPVHMAIFASSFLPGSHECTEDISTCLEMIDGYAAILTGNRELDPREGEELRDIVTWDLPRKKRTYGWNFEVCPLTRSTRDGKWIDPTIAKHKRTDPANISGIQLNYGNVNDEKFFVFKLVEQKGKRGDKIEYTFVAKCYFSTPIHPLHLAIWIGHPLVVEKLIHSFKGMRHFSLETDNGDTVLHLAFKAMEFDRIFSKFEIKSWLRPNLDGRIWSEDYITKGMNYASREQVMTIMMRYLHSYPHLLNSQNKDGQTPLHIAIFHGNLSCVRALLRCDYANFNIRNKNEVTPIDMVLKLDSKYSHCMYASILGGKCTLSEEVGFRAVNCNDVLYFGEYGRIIDHLMEALDSDIVRQRRILQLSQWSCKHRIYALQMIDENPTVGLESVKQTYLEQCDQKLPEPGDYPWAILLSKMDGMAIKQVLQILKYGFIKETSKQYGDKRFEDEQRIFAAIEDGDGDEFERLFSDSKGEIFSIEYKNYERANPLHWAVLHGELRILSLISSEDKAYLESYEKPMEDKTGTKIVDVTDGFGFTCVHFALFYSLSVRLNDRYKPVLQSDERFTSRQRERRGDHGTYNKMIEKLHEMGFCYTGLNQGSWRDGCGDFVMWSITSTDVIHVDTYVTNTRFYPIHLAVHCAQPKNFKRLLESTPEEAWADSNVETGDTILHNAEGWEVVMRHCSKDEWRKIEPSLLKQLQDLKAVNSRNGNRETPLHRAVRTKSLKWVEVLLQFEHLRFNLRDQDMLTPGDRAAEMMREASADADSVQKIVHLLDCYDPKSWPRKKEMEQKRERDEEMKRRDDQLKAEKKIEEDRKQIEEVRKRTEALQRERQVYVDAANAILVGGALIASASFGAWLQPPLGLHPYYSPEFLDTSAPPAMGPIYDSYVAIQQHWTIQMFWVFNSLSFFFSLATVIAGADAALPSSQGSDVQEALDSVKRAGK